MDPTKILLESAKFRVVRREYQTPDGVNHIRDIVVHPGAVTILPVFDDGRVCLIRNFRLAVDQTLIELPAGTLEPGEDPRVTAERELAEETGYRATGWQKLCEFFMSPGILNERMHLYLATGLSAGGQDLDSGEQIENLVVPWAEAMEMVQAGKIQDSKTLAGLLFYDRFRQRESGRH